MNCEKCQDLVSELIDGSLNRNDLALLEAHLGECLECAEVRNDLSAIVNFCHEHRGEYDAPANERALWLRISNTIESERAVLSQNSPARSSGFAGFLNRSWQFTFPQLAASAAAIVVVVALATAFGVRRWQNPGMGTNLVIGGTSVKDRYRHQQQVIEYWNSRVEMNKARWNPQMRETFDRNMGVIDAAVADSLRELNANPHDEVSEEMLNAALSDKVALLKEFAEL